MTLCCDKCGGPRTNGSPVTRDAGETVLAHGATKDSEIIGYYCRECVKSEI
jgi:hypothetical protein